MSTVADLLKSMGPRTIVVVGLAYVGFGIFAYLQADPGSDLKMFLFEFKKAGGTAALSKVPEIPIPPKEAPTGMPKAESALTLACRASLLSTASEEAEALLEKETITSVNPTSVCEQSFRAEQSVETGVLLARALVVSGSYVRARALFEEYAEKGDPHSNLVLGHVYSDYRDRDSRKALSHYFRAFAKGEPYAAYGLGLYLELGMSDTPNYSLAAAMYNAAASSGVAEAQYRLGQLYYFGLGVPQETTAAMKLLRQAAAQDYKPAIEYMEALP